MTHGNLNLAPYNSLFFNYDIFKRHFYQCLTHTMETLVLWRMEMNQI